MHEENKIVEINNIFDIGLFNRHNINQVRKFMINLYIFVFICIIIYNIYFICSHGMVFNHLLNSEVIFLHL